MDCDYSFANIKYENRSCNRLKQYHRLLMYYHAIEELMDNKSEIDNSNTNRLKKFLDKESELEKRIYVKLKKWEERHPIMGIIICTILLGILISLLAGIILEAVY